MRRLGLDKAAARSMPVDLFRPPVLPGAQLSLF